jgi:hypothetical protein
MSSKPELPPQRHGIRLGTGTQLFLFANLVGACTTGVVVLNPANGYIDYGGPSNEQKPTPTAKPAEAVRMPVTIIPTTSDRTKPTVIATQTAAIRPTPTPWQYSMTQFTGSVYYKAPLGKGCNPQTEEMLNNGGMGGEAEQRTNKAYATTSHPNRPLIPGTDFKLVETCALNDGTGYILVEDEHGALQLVKTIENSNNPVHKTSETQCFGPNTNDPLFGGQKEPGRSIARKMGAQFGVCYQLTGGESGQVAIFNPPLINRYPGAGWTPTRTPQAVRK